MKVVALALTLLFLSLTAQAWAFTWTENEKRISVSQTWKLAAEGSDYIRATFRYEEQDGKPTLIWGGLDAIGDWDTRAFWKRVHMAITGG